MSNKDFTQEMLEKLSRTLKGNPSDIMNQAQSGDLSSLTKNLSESQKEKVNSILSDPEKQKMFLSNPQVRALLEKLGLGG